jgi:hypothetical protein
MIEGEKIESHQKRILKLKRFSPLKILTPLLFEETLGAFLFPFLCSISWGLGGFDNICGEDDFFKNFFSSGFNILAVDAYSRMEWCTPTWPKHDYGDGAVVDILAVDTCSGVEVCTPIFLGEASKIFWVANHFRKKFKIQMDKTLNKAQHKQELLYG